MHIYDLVAVRPHIDVMRRKVVFISLWDMRHGVMCSLEGS